MAYNTTDEGAYLIKEEIGIKAINGKVDINLVSTAIDDICIWGICKLEGQLRILVK